MWHEASRRSLVAPSEKVTDSLTEAGQSNYNALQKILPLNYVSYAIAKVSVSISVSIPISE